MLGKKTIFISYAREDEVKKDEILKMLLPLEKKYSVEIIFDKKFIFAGENYDVKIKDLINSAGIVLSLLSNNFIKKSNCITELNLAINNYNEKEKLVIPIILEEYNPIKALPEFDYAKIKHITYVPSDKPIDKYDNPEEAHNKVKEAVKRAIEVMWNKNDPEREFRFKRLEEKRNQVIKSDEKKDKLKKIFNLVEMEWNNLDEYDYVYPHNHIRCEKLEEIIYSLIPPGEVGNRIKEDEWFFLIAAVWLHDIGMHPKILDVADLDDDEESIGIHQQILPRDALEDKTDNLSVRENHHIRSEKFIRQYGKKEFGLSDYEVKILALICLFHRKYMYHVLHNEKIWPDDSEKYRFIVAYLRLANAVYVPEIEAEKVKIYLSHGMTELAVFNLFKSMFAVDCEIIPNYFKITLVINKPNKLKNNINLDTLKEWLQEQIQVEIEIVKDILVRRGLTVYLEAECKYGKSQNKYAKKAYSEQDQVDLVNKFHVFNITYTPNASSVIENVLEHIKYFLNDDQCGKKDIIDNLRNYRSNVLEDIIKKRQCSVFFQRIKAELIRHLDNCDELTADDNVKSIRDVVDGLKDKYIRVKEDIPIMAYPLFAGGLSILLYGYSATVINCIDYYFSKIDINNFKMPDIYICEVSGKTQYNYNNRLIYCDAVWYAGEIWNMLVKYSNKLSIKDEYAEKIKLIPDACAASLFKQGKVAKVIFGANGIGLNGCVSHSMGHLAIADLAKMYNVPVYVIADTTKIGNIIKSDKQRGNSWPTTDIRFESKVKMFGRYNPRQDIVPYDRITAIITEHGMVKPQDIKMYADAKNSNIVKNHYQCIKKLCICQEDK